MDGTRSDWDSPTAAANGWPARCRGLAGECHYRKTAEGAATVVERFYR